MFSLFSLLLLLCFLGLWSVFLSSGCCILILFQYVTKQREHFRLHAFSKINTNKTLIVRSRNFFKKEINSFFPSLGDYRKLHGVFICFVGQGVWKMNSKELSTWHFESGLDKSKRRKMNFWRWDLRIRSDLIRENIVD